jgi:nucleotide-binding universal stress UspA family protein
MAIVNILIHAEPGAAGAARVRYALSLAARFDATLTGISVVVPPTEVAFAMMGDARLYGVALDAAKESSETAKSDFEALIAGAPVAVRWQAAEGIPEEAVAAFAGVHDLTILGSDDRSDPDGGFYVLRPADIILASGRPVLVLPAGAPPVFTGDRILVAWRNTAEAARAVHDALPFLKRALEVVLAEITEPGGDGLRPTVTIEDMADHLKSHGVSARCRIAPAAGASAGPCLLALAEEAKADLVVAGAYGHSRFREWALGGVTRYLLSESPLPCLLSH